MGRSFVFRARLLLLLAHLVLDASFFAGVESFLINSQKSRYGDQVALPRSSRTKYHSPMPTTSTRKTSLFQERRQARRWNGNYKHASKRLADVPKSKKLMIKLTANGVTKTLEKKRMETCCPPPFLICSDCHHLNDAGCLDNVCSAMLWLVLAYSAPEPRMPPSGHGRQRCRWWPTGGLQENNT